MNMNKNSHITSERVRRAIRWRFNPVRNLNVERLSQQLDAFDSGLLREAANSWEVIEKRDDILRSVIPKRKKAVARHGWVVLPARDLQAHEQAEAKRQIAALEAFYRNVECENAVDENERGGFSLLVRQMMDAVGKRYAVHEIIWRPTVDGTLSANFRFVPLAFFENTTGELRFLTSEMSQEGVALKEGEWMVTVGDGLMMASSIAWMFKHMGLNDWLIYSERNGTPGLRGITSAARNTADWDAMEDVVSDILEGLPVVTNTSEDIKVLDHAVGGNIPFPELVERMDRVMASMWRGADLSTLSRDRGYGASLQEKEACVLEEDDAQMISETLNRYVDRWVIKYVFGEREVLARVKLLVSPRECTSEDAQIDEFLLRAGAPLSVASVMERYGRAMPRPGEELLNAGTAEVRKGKEDPASSHAIENSNPPPHGGGYEGLANSTAFNLLQKEWIQLSPYGDFPHAQGLQRVTFAAAREMERRFGNLASRAARLFAGAPMFVGHPDVPSLANQYSDKKAYGWIMALEARPEGLFGRVKWSEAGLELLENGHYKFVSPYWEARPVGKENGAAVFEPVALLSAGLTNEPNLPVLPLANCAGSPPPYVGGHAEGNPPPYGGGYQVMLPNVRAAIEEALANGRLTPNQISSMQHELAEDWEVGSARLRAAPILMHTRAITEKLATRKHESARFYNRRVRIHDLVRGRMAKGVTYDQAWSEVKVSNPDLF